MTILALCDHYLPGFKAGGPIRSIQSLVKRLSGEFHFRIVTNNYDWGESSCHPGIKSGVWTEVDSTEVLYLDRGARGLEQLYRQLKRVDYDLLYLNSMLSRRMSMAPLVLRRLGLLPRRPVVLAPRGECSPGALRLKSSLKRVFLGLSRLVDLHQGVVWHGSTDLEKQAILKAVGGANNIRTAPILVAPDLVMDDSAAASHAASGSKMMGAARLVFLSRISPMKNLEQALQLVGQLRGDIEFDIFGPLDSTDYWNNCQKRMRSLPSHVKVAYRGSVSAAEVPAVLSGYHALVLPTKGENFGHVIVEALLAGCPVAISDRTPWRNLQAAGVGWDISLDDSARFVAALQQVVDMTSAEHRKLSMQANFFAQAYVRDDSAIEMNRSLFRFALEAPSAYNRRN